MADDEKKKEEVSEKTEEAPPKGFPIKMILIAVVMLVVAGGGVAVWKSGMLSKPEPAIASESVETNKKQMDIGPIYSLDTFIVNLLGGQGKNYLKAKFELEMGEEGLKEEIDKRLPQFRDVILTLLSSKNYNDIKTLEGKYQLREEIIMMLNQKLQNGKIVNVYFTDFIVQ